MFGFGRHWEIIKKENDGYVEYDSLKEGPAALTNQELLKRLEDLNTNNATILKIVQKKQTEPLLQVTITPSP